MAEAAADLCILIVPRAKHMTKDLLASNSAPGLLVTTQSYNRGQYQHDYKLISFGSP